MIDTSNNMKQMGNDVAPIIEVNNVFKTFGKTNSILKGVSFIVNKGESLVVLGKSGSGKSVLIKCMVALVQADAGEIKLFGKDVLKMTTKALNEIRIKTGFLFQNAALYDSMSVKENLSFPLVRQQKKITNNELNTAIAESLQQVGLADAIYKMPAELSGGMRKRIGLARSIILNPEIILYDEPTTGLDTITSKEISELIIHIQKRYNTTSIIITHDMACAKLTGNRIILLKDGIIHAGGTYSQLENSTDEWVRSFFI